MAMKFYADAGVRRTRQIVTDAVFVAWCLAAIWLGRFVHQHALIAQTGAQKLESGSNDLSSRMKDAAGAVDNIPLVGSSVRTPFDKAASAGHDLASSGHDLATGFGRFAVLLGLLTALLPILLALMPWSFVRLRYAFAAGRLARLRSMPGGQRLLALEALTTARPKDLAAIGDDPARAWQDEDPVATRRLADLALATRGLRIREALAAPAPATAPIADGAHEAPDEPRRPWQG